MCVCVFCSVPVQNLFIMCQNSAPSLVVKRGQVGANYPDCWCRSVYTHKKHTDTLLFRTFKRYSDNDHLEEINKSTDVWIIKQAILMFMI